MLKYLFIFISFLISNHICSQDKKLINPVFKDIIEIKTTPVKSQYFTGTCWDFATLSFIESELIRTKGQMFDLSEKFVARANYIDRLAKYMQCNGNSVIQQGGQAHDVLLSIKKYGIVPESVYPILSNDDNTLIYRELSNALRGMAEGIIKNAYGKFTKNFPSAVEGLLNLYLGKVPSEFEYQGKKYTPETFYKNEITLDFDKYIELTSINNKPYYDSIELDLSDNWRKQHYFNLPVDELVSLVDNSLKKGYSIVWDGDVTQDKYDVNRTVYMVDFEKSCSSTDSTLKFVTNLRQTLIDSGKTTDDHLMHIVGTASDNEGKIFYKLKDSAGTSHPYVYMSKPYFILNTIAVLVNKDIMAEGLKKKLKIK